MERMLWDALQSVPDHHHPSGHWYPLASLLALATAARFAGRDSLAGIFHCGRKVNAEALKALGPERRRAPCRATYYYLCHGLDVGALEMTLASWVRGSSVEIGHLALDGKELRGSRHVAVARLSLSNI